MTALHGLILAAGRGSRLGPLNEGRPKCLATVAGRSILDRQFEALGSVGVRDVVVVTGFEADMLEDVAQGLATRYALRPRFVRNPEWASTNVLRSWMAAAPLMDTPYLYMHADTVFEPDLLHRLVAGHHAAATAGVTITLDRHPCADEEMKVILRDDMVVRISKQLEPNTVDGEFTGVLACSASAHSHLVDIGAALLNRPGAEKAFFEAALQEAIDAGRFECRSIDITGLRWREVDFPEDLHAAGRIFAAVRSPGA